MENKTFKNPDELANYIIKTFNFQLDRLNAIFYYEVNNIMYDEESILTNSLRYKTLEEIFETNLGVCEHFSLFMYEIAKMCEINEFKISKFQNFAKGSDVDPFNIPEEQESDSCS